MKLIFSILIAILWSMTLTFGQANSKAYGQNPLSSILDKLNGYNNHHLQEKIFMHTDRSFYLAGETIWLKLFYVDGSFHRPLHVSKVAYIEILDGNHKPVLQSKLALTEDGFGSGSISLPVSMGSGCYLIRAYTNWMKNFSPELYFQQCVTVVNPFTQITPMSIETTEDYDVQFFPEGGNLVNGLKCVVGFRAVNKSGWGIDFHGAIVDEKNDTIAKIKPLKFGLGRFTFTPTQGHTYNVVFKDSKQQSFSFKLPASFDEGMVLSMNETAEQIKVSVNMISKSAMILPVVHLLVQTRQKIMMQDTQILQDGAAVFAINKNSLGEGISRITIFNGNLIPVCERLVFKKPIQQLMVDVRSESNDYGLRKKVEIAIHTALRDKKKASANLSASVYKMDSLGDSGTNIVNYLLMTSDLKGNIESPDYYFENGSSEEKREATDNLMLTQGWTRFKWEDVFRNPHAAEYVPEYGGHLITAQIRNVSANGPAVGILTYLTSLGLFTRPYLATSNAQGRLLFEMQNFYGNNELIAQTNTQQDSLYKIEIQNPFSEKNSTFAIPELDLKEKVKTALQRRSIHMQVQNIFTGNKRGLFKTPQFDSAMFYGLSDGRFKLDDYTRFPTMEEVMREYVSGVEVRKRKDGFHFQNYDLVNRRFFVNDPFVMMDGMPVLSIDKIMSFDPRLVKSIEVVNRRYYLGRSVFEGIVSYRTYKGDLGGFQPDPNCLSTGYEGLQLQREFFSPQYETPMQRESTIPDTRNLLYWAPNVLTNLEGEGRIRFYTSDIKGKYKVVIQGISNDGFPGYSTTTFEVK